MGREWLHNRTRLTLRDSYNFISQNLIFYLSNCDWRRRNLTKKFVIYLIDWEVEGVNILAARANTYVKFFIKKRVNQ